MVGMFALGTAALWIVASALTPLQANQVTRPVPETAEQGQVASEEQDSAAIDGEKLFAGVCGFCHADGGRKASKGPKLAGSARSDEFIIDRIKRGKPGRMPAFGSFTDEQIHQILVYIRSLEP
jgi:mono/diheme cytochrome c family protein